MGGLFAAFLGAFLWSVITIAINFQIGYMALGLGLLVGLSVQFYGAGFEKKFGILGGSLSFLACFIGNFFGQLGLMANAEGMSFVEVVPFINAELSISIITESFQLIDFVFYAIAIYEGYYFSFRKVNSMFLTKFQVSNFEGKPKLNRLRFPLALISFVGFVVVILVVSRGKNDLKQYFYPNGRLMSQGMLKNSKEDGIWKTWDEQGNLQVKGNFTNGVMDGDWEWFNTLGRRIKFGQFEKGLKTGVWMNYYETGIMMDSGKLVTDRMHGFWKVWYPNGTLSQAGFYNKSVQDSIWTYYYENEQISTYGKVKNGEQEGLWLRYNLKGDLLEEIFHFPENKLEVLNVWDLNGNPIVVNGDGTYKFYSTDGKLVQTGQIENKKRVGKWQFFALSGRLYEEGEFVDDTYTLINTWDQNGDQHIVDGYGMYKTYFDDGESLAEVGRVKNGNRVGKWKSYYAQSGNIYQELHYENGKLNGHNTVYYESGQIFTTGDIVDDLKEGEWSWYHENGVLSSVANFNKNKKNGLQTMWSDVGNKIVEETYQNGELLEEVIL